jgi:hypothetical protein
MNKAVCNAATMVGPLRETAHVHAFLRLSQRVLKLKLLVNMRKTTTF